MILSINGRETFCCEKEYPIAKTIQNRTKAISAFARLKKSPFDMTTRRVEFDKRTKLLMFKRAGGPTALACENCGRPLNGKAFEYDHTIECWERLDMQAGGRIVLTADDGKLLGKGCCHMAKSNKKKGEKAHGDRIIAKAAKAQKRKSSRPMPGSRDSPWKKKFSGWERR